MAIFLGVLVVMITLLISFRTKAITAWIVGNSEHILIFNPIHE